MKIQFDLIILSVYLNDVITKNVHNQKYEVQTQFIKNFIIIRYIYH